MKNEYLEQLLELHKEINKIYKVLNLHSEIIKELMEKAPPDELLTVTEVAKLLNLTESTIYTRVSEKTIPFKKNGKRLYFSKNEVLKMVQAQTE